MPQPGFDSAEAGYVHSRHRHKQVVVQSFLPGKGRMLVGKEESAQRQIGSSPVFSSWRQSATLTTPQLPKEMGTFRQRRQTLLQNTSVRLGGSC